MKFLISFFYIFVHNRSFVYNRSFLDILGGIFEIIFSNSQPRLGKLMTEIKVHKPWALTFLTDCILVPRGCAPFGKHQESWPLGRSNTRSSRFMDFQSLCMLRVKLDHLIGWEYEKNSLCMLRKLDFPRGGDPWCWPKAVRPLGTRMNRLRFGNECRKLHKYMSQTFCFSLFELLY